MYYQSLLNFVQFSDWNKSPVEFQRAWYWSKFFKININLYSCCWLRVLPNWLRLPKSSSDAPKPSRWPQLRLSPPETRPNRTTSLPLQTSADVPSEICSQSARYFPSPNWSLQSVGWLHCYLSYFVCRVLLISVPRLKRCAIARCKLVTMQLILIGNSFRPCWRRCKVTPEPDKASPSLVGMSLRPLLTLSPLPNHSKVWFPRPVQYWCCNLLIMIVCLFLALKETSCITLWRLISFDVNSILHSCMIWYGFLAILWILLHFYIHIV